MTEPLTAAGSRAIETLRGMGFTLQSHTGAHRLTRMGQQVALYNLAGGFGENTGHIANIEDVTRSDAAVAAIPLARLILKDEATRLALPPFSVPPLNGKPYG